MNIEHLQKENKMLYRWLTVCIVMFFLLVVVYVVSWLELKKYKVVRLCGSFSSYEEAHESGKECKTRFPSK